MAERRAAIAGGGIGGLTAAIALARTGWRVTVFERAERLAEIGAGLQLSPNATRLLDRLGLLQAVAALAVEPEAVRLRRADSWRTLATVPLGAAARRRWGAPYLVLHRADLQRALAEAAAAAPGVELLTAHEVTGWERGAQGVNVRTADGRGLGPFDLLVAADGVWSALRGGIAGARAARFSGDVAWRTTVDIGDARFSAMAERLARNEVTAVLAPGLHLVAYPVRGGVAINLVAVTKGRAEHRSWDSEGNGALLQERFRSAGQALAELRAGDLAWRQWPIFTVDPAGPWSDGAHVALIGDAAHAMTPYAAQGAAMAIEDAACLARYLEETPAVAEALARYRALRIDRISRVARRAAFNRFAWHAAGPIAWARDRVLSARAPERLAADFDWLYGHDATRM